MESNAQSSEIIFLIAIGTLIMLSLALAFVLFFNLNQKKIARQQILNQQLELQYQQDLLQRNIMTQEEERRRIASDLHDEIGSKLNVLHLNLHRIKRMQSATPEFAETLEDINALLQTTIDTSRRLAYDLLPPTLEDFGLIEAVKELCKYLKQSGVTDIEFTAELDKEDLTSSLTQLNLFRIIQELVNNSLKHGGASLINIRLSKDDNGICLDFQDNGSGFDMNTVQKNGLGLRNLDSRMKILRASYIFKSAPGEGVELIATHINNA